MKQINGKHKEANKILVTMKDSIRDSIKEHIENGRKRIEDIQARDLEHMQK